MKINFVVDKNAKKDSPNNKTSNFDSKARYLDEVNDEEMAIYEKKDVDAVHTKPKYQQYYNNSNISVSYSQINIEKSLILLTCSLFINTMLFLTIYLNLDFIVMVFIIVSAFFDLIPLLFYIYLLIKFNRENVFCQISKITYFFEEIIITINLFIRTATLVLVIFNSTDLGLWIIIIYVTKYVLDIYFTLISIKLFSFSPCNTRLQECFERVFASLKVNLFCYDNNDDLEDISYSKIEDSVY